ncbi:MAG: hypothetical protein DSZ08_08225 [Sulfurovum sp.]|nr:MAG: hypothetical protein DSZ08_08225 [Sulfurovum sp.]
MTLFFLGLTIFLTRGFEIGFFTTGLGDILFLIIGFIFSCLVTTSGSIGSSFFFVSSTGGMISGS